jgi:hypothetical protein
MQVRIGDVVKMRDGRVVDVTDAPEDITSPFEWISKADYERGVETVTATMPAETIFIGKTKRGNTVVSDMSEVVSILS